MTIAHSTLTGTDLHEPKGIAAATVGKVYVSNGSGSGAWTATGLLAPLLHVREQESQGTGSQSAATTLSWVTNVINAALTNEISGASLASNQITLPIGTYFIDAAVTYAISSALSVVNAWKPRLYNNTAASSLLEGMAITLQNGATGSTVVSQGVSHVRGRFTLAAPSVVLLQHIKTAGSVPSPSQQGTEVYLDAMIWKIS